MLCSRLRNREKSSTALEEERNQKTTTNVQSNRLDAHMYNKSKAGESEMCPCNADIMTTEHLQQHCRLHDALRRDMWPEPTLLRDKPYGNLEELRRTAAFVRTTGISI